MAEALERARDPKELQNSRVGRVHVGTLVQSFDAVRMLVKNPSSASLVVPLQQILREVNTVCVDFARFALAYTAEAGSVDKADGAYRQLALSQVQLPITCRLSGQLMADSLRNLPFIDCAVLDTWLTSGLVATLYGGDAVGAHVSPLPTGEQVRALMEAMIRSGELEPGKHVGKNVLLEVLRGAVGVPKTEVDGYRPGTHPAFDDAASGGDDNGKDG